MAKYGQYLAPVVRWFPWLIFITAVVFAVCVLFSNWAINSEYFGKYDMGMAILFAFTHAYALYASMLLALLALILSAVYKIARQKGSRILLLSFIVGLLPVLILSI